MIVLKMSKAIMMRYMLLMLCLVVSVNSDNCVLPWMITGHEVAESQYLIDLSVKNTQHGMASTYFPDTQYDIIIRPKRETLTFKEFILKMENVNRSMSYGALELREPELSTFSPQLYCINRVINLANMAKPNITIGWQSPPPKSGCIMFKARVKETDLRYHTANLTVCEDPRIELDDPGKPLEFCCACEKAKYELIFEGMWSKFTHPRGFPKKDWLAGFPTVVGAAHDPHYEIWDKYKNATDGLKRFAESGSSLALELELKAHQGNITTLIKFRGTNFKNNTLARAQLRVDRVHHVLSLVSKIYPSPDWFIGVSSLELCKSDCTWMENKTLNLYAYDAGAKSGLEFEQENNEITQDVINPMNMSWPLPDKYSIPPFYDKTNNTHEVRPMAQIHLRRIRVFGTTCAANGTTTSVEEDESYCVGEWNKTAQCTVTCGSGFIVHTREYKEGFNSSNCQAAVEKRLKCGSDYNKCEDVIDEETCETTEWSGWKKCSQPCGQESTDRTRYYKLDKYTEKCKQTFPDHSLAEYKDCGHPPCPGEKSVCSDSLYSSWSEWTICSVTVGRGLQYRHRDKLAQIISKEIDHNDAGYTGCLYEKRVCNGIDPSSITEAPVVEEENGSVLTMHRSFDLRPIECTLPIKEGISCPGIAAESRRWAYVVDSKSCELFKYNGCGGNDNNFMDEIACHEKCSSEEIIDCKMSEWSEWTGCTGCIVEERRIKYPVVFPSRLGKACPTANKLEKRPCPKKTKCNFQYRH